jgi:hypothetical protein
MAIMIPDKPIEVTAASLEAEMFAALENLSDDYYVFHSFVLISNVNGTQYESETDFIIFNPQKGIICIEAKAGQVKCINGEWFYGSGIKMNHGGPYRKADLDKWKLEKYFEQKGLKHLWDKCKVLHAVWFPSITRAYLNMIQMPADGDKSITLTKDSFDNIQEAIDALFEVNLPSGIQTNLTPPESKKILSSILCPSFNLVPCVASEVAIKRNAFNRLLKEQAVLLNFLEEQPCAVISGVAGTGKTMIAVEKARRHAELGEKVLFLCFNRQLCDYLREKHFCENVYYFTIDGLASFVCNSSDASFEELEEKLTDMYYNGKFPYKHIIIDEGQDFGQNRIEETSIIQTLESIVLSDEIGGTFYLFYDKNQLVQGQQIPKYISDSDCKLTLYKNCRNTENIAITSMRPLGKDKKPKMFQGCVRGSSPDINIALDEESSLNALNNILKKLFEERIEDIVILTCSTEEQSWLTKYCNGGCYQFNNRTMKFTSCRKFKGLEADAIILVDITKNTFDVNGNNLLFWLPLSYQTAQIYPQANLYGFPLLLPSLCQAYPLQIRTP